jgi:hypothetical protein
MGRVCSTGAMGRYMKGIGSITGQMEEDALSTQMVMSTKACGSTTRHTASAHIHTPMVRSIQVIGRTTISMGTGLRHGLTARTMKESTSTA